jgi:hypothetical protein
MFPQESVVVLNTVLSAAALARDNWHFDNDRDVRLTFFSLYPRARKCEEMSKCESSGLFFELLEYN